MRTIPLFVAVIALGSGAFADIQDPPSNDFGPTRKLGRGFSNLLWAPTEIVVNINQVNKDEGNNAAFGYGVVRGFSRSATRHAVGLIEILTWPFPIWHGGYYPILPPEIPYIHAGYSEFPPEIGNQSKYPYVRDYDQDPY